MDVNVAVSNPTGQAATVIWTTDRALRFTSAQGGALKASGSLGEGFVGMSLFEFFHTEDPDFPPIAAHLRALDGESATYQAEAWGRSWDCQVEPFRDAGGTIVGTVGIALDATSRREADEALRQSRQQYEDLVNSIDGIVWEADPTTVQFTFVSQRAERLLGYPVARWLEEPTFWQDHMHPDDRDWAVQFCAVATAELRPHEFEYRMIAADGRIVWLRDIVTVLVEDGRPVKLRGVMVDVTERKRATEALEQSEERLRLMTDQVPAALWTTDTEQRVSTIRGALLRTMGLSPELMIGRYVVDAAQTNGLGYPEVAPYFAALRGESVSYEATIRDRAMDLHLEPLRDGMGNIIGTIGVAFDITEQKRAQEALRDSEARFRSAFFDAPIGMALVALDGAFLQVNRSYCELTGYTESEMLSRTFQSITHPDDVDADVEDYKRQLAGEITHYAMEKRFIHKRGHIVWGLLSVSLVRDARGQPLYAVSQVQDITQKKQTEEALREREEQYRSIFEATSDGLMISDLETGLIVATNPACDRMHGYEAGEMVGLRPDVFVHPEDRHLFEDYQRTVEARREFRTRARAFRKDRTVFHVEVYGTGFLYRGRPHALSVIRDVTEQVRGERILEQQVAARTQELESLLGIGRAVASTLDLNQLVRLILAELKEVVGFNAASLILNEGHEIVVHDLIAPDKPGIEARPTGVRFPLDIASDSWRAVSRSPSVLDYPCVQVATSPEFWERMNQGESVIIPDVLTSEERLAEGYRSAMGDLLRTPAFDFIRTWMAVPLALKDRIIGYIGLSNDAPGYFTEKHARLARAFADQAAVAIENARLYEQARQFAALEERQRLARELHDSVSQALFGIVLGATTTRKVLERDPAQAREPLDYVLSLAEAGLAEMRALIFELRPESLETEGLVAALAKQAAAVRARHEIEVHAELGEEPPLPLGAKEALYRVAQEALHNVVKHAAASRVDLRLHRVDGHVLLEVRDDGVGFDTVGDFPGHLGLKSMRERATRLGGALAVDSAPGRGTTVRVHVPAEPT